MDVKVVVPPPGVGEFAWVVGVGVRVGVDATPVGVRVGVGPEDCVAVGVRVGEAAAVCVRVAVGVLVDVNVITSCGGLLPSREENTTLSLLSPPSTKL